MDAQQQATVVLTQAAGGRVALRVEADGSFVLAEQLDTQALAPGQVMAGRMDVIGLEDWADRSDGEQRFAVFIQAYGLSWEAVRAELA
ncbi:hypothetical protein [Roseateles cavernae]|uniref:hypothetical protein n=1 Tax=Roseateles cavernae TaxID=3153578 RepID=UPI0032E3DB4A